MIFLKSFLICLNSISVGLRSRDFRNGCVGLRLLVNFQRLDFRNVSGDFMPEISVTDDLTHCIRDSKQRILVFFSILICFYFYVYFIVLFIFIIFVCLFIY